MAALLLVMGAQMLPHAAVKLHFHEPVVLSGSFPNPGHVKSPWEPATIDGNESIGCDSYHSLDGKHLFGQYEQYTSRGSGKRNETAATLWSGDAGRSWSYAGQTPLQGEHAYARSGEGVLHTISVGLAGVGPAEGPWTELSTSASGRSQTEFSSGADGTLQTRSVQRVVTLGGIPPEFAIDPFECSIKGGFFPPVASTLLPDRSQLLTLTLCTVNRVNVSFCEVVSERFPLIPHQYWPFTPEFRDRRIEDGL
jgi:hypothetical protein